MRTNDILINGALVFVGALVTTAAGVIVNAAKDAAVDLYDRIQERREENE